MISSGFTQPGPVRYHTHISPHTPQSGHGGENTQHTPPHITKEHTGKHNRLSTLI